MRDPAPPSAALDAVAARRLAKRICATAFAWTRTFSICVGRSSSGLEDEVLEEVLAYALCLLDLRLASAPAESTATFSERVRCACRALKAELRHRRSARQARLPAPASASDEATPQFSRQYLAWAEGNGGRAKFTPEMFEEFCRTTGLSSNVLVGGGENLATLVFYLVLHGLFSQAGPLSRRQGAELLRAARQCRGQLNTMLARELSDAPVAPEAGSAVLGATKIRLLNG